MPQLTEPNILRVFLHSAFIPPLGANRGRVHDSTAYGAHVGGFLGAAILAMVAATVLRPRFRRRDA